MGCIVAFIGLLAPRFALFCLWIFSNRMTVAFDRFVIGFIGFLVLPFTTLMWALAYAPSGGVHGFGWILVAFGLFLDLGNYGNSGAETRRRRA